MFENRLKRINKKQRRSINIFEGVRQSLKLANAELENVLKEIDEEQAKLQSQAHDAFKLLSQNEKVINNISNIIGGETDED